MFLCTDYSLWFVLEEGKETWCNPVWTVNNWASGKLDLQLHPEPVPITY